jgi:uncharacterized RDD family membrane protein YckC
MSATMPPYEQPTGPPSGVPPFASWGSRALAQILDSLIVAVVPVIVAIALVVADQADLANIVASGLGIVVGAIYYAVTMSRSGPRNGQTLGKQALDIRVVRESGEPIAPGFAALREVLVKSILMGICFIVLILDWLSMLWDDRNQCWHDKIVGSLVVKA